MEAFKAWRHDVAPTPHEANERLVLRWTGGEDALDEAEAEARSLLYQELAAHPFCRLIDADRTELQRRGISDQAIERHSYFTYPSRDALWQVMRDLERWAETHEMLPALWRLPGVYARDRRDGPGFVNLLAPMGGQGALAIPVHDVQGRTIAIKLRFRDSELQRGGPRYKWLSVNDTSSRSSGAPLHVALPSSPHGRQRMIITEGPLKANIAAERLRCIVLAVPGISIVRGVLPALGELCARGDITQDVHIAVAYDQEPNNPQVTEARTTLIAALSERYRHVAVMDWDPRMGKGIDDALLAGAEIREQRVPWHNEFNQNDETDDSTAAPHSQTAEKSKRGPSIADKLVRLALTSGAVLFHDPQGVPYVSAPVEGHWETWPVRSSNTRLWLRRCLWLAEEKSPGGEALQSALGVLEAQALFSGSTQSVHVRLAEHEQKIYLDLGDEEWRAVEVDGKGWRVVARPPVQFRRPKGMLPLPTPRAGGAITELRRFVNVRDEDWPLLIGFLVGVFRPGRPFPALGLHGEQGSAKSTQARVIRALCDPNHAPLRSEPKEERDLAIAANNAWLPVFDNLSGMPGWLSDALCRLLTGAGFGTRTLYENDEETLFNAMRPIILTGIEEVATRPDLLDRSILLDLPRITDETRKTEAIFWQDFEKARPRILGALLTAVSQAIRKLPNTTTKNLPRMADFAQWVIAAEPALGWECGTFLKAYQANRAGANDLALEASMIGQALLGFIAPGGEFTGTAKDLLDALNQKYPQHRELRGWPGSPRALSGAIRRIAPNLRASGLAVPDEPKRSGKARTWTLRRAPEDAGESTSHASHASHSHTNAETNGGERAPANDANGDANGRSDASAVTCDETMTQDTTTFTPDTAWDSDEGDGSDATYSQSSNGHHISFPDRLEQLAKQGITGDAAVRRVLEERGGLPREQGA